MEDYVSNQILTTTVNIEAKHIQGDINKLLFKHLQNKFEGVCNEDGYIQKGSLEIINRSIGEIKTINNINYIVFNLTYKAIILTPVKGIKLNIIIDSITKMGVIGYLKKEESDTIKNSPFIVIVPNEYFDHNDISKYSINDTLDVIIKAARVKYLSTSIQVVATPI